MLEKEDARLHAVGKRKKGVGEKRRRKTFQIALKPQSFRKLGNELPEECLWR